MKFTEGAFRDWGYQMPRRIRRGRVRRRPVGNITEGKPGAGIIIKDAIADITLQQV